MSADVVAIPSACRLKFLCSHGGKIFPRPSDGHLKYAGGETRVISVPKDIRFHELMKKLTHSVDGEMRLKYQVESEDLAALVSVRSDEDLRHMLDEIEHYQISGAPRLRAFLFPTDPVAATDTPIGASVDPRVLEQRYIDAINGITRPAPNPIRLQPTKINTMHHGSRASSAGSSPRSPESCTTEAMNNKEQSSIYYNSSNSGRSKMHRVRSSPSICSHSVSPQYNHQVSSQCVHYPGFQLPRPPIDPQKSVGPKRLMSVRSFGRTEGLRYQVDSLPPQYYTPCVSRQSRGNGFVHYDECGHFFNNRVTDRNGSPILSNPFGYQK